jgi:CRISPR-associated endonuclease/helicase Cas3
VLDEAQMIPLPYLLPCVRALKELIINYNVTVVLATATQSSLDEYFKPLIPTEIVKNPKEMYDFFRRVTYKRIEGVLSNEDIANRLSKHNQVLCVVNTRRRAQKIAELLGDGDEVFHLSTTMYPAHRSSVLKEIKARLKNSKPCRVVSTSMIEAGVDIDFPVLYREKAGLDSIIQAAGRCNREGEQSAGESLVYVFETEGSSPRIIKQNIAAYDYAERENEDIASLDAIETYFRQLRYIIGQEGLDKKSVVEKFNSSSMFPFKDVAEDFHLIDDSTKTVIIPNTPEAIELVDKLRKGERSRDILRELQQYSVSLYEKTDIKQLDEYGAIARIDEKILVLSVESYYNSKYGVTLSSKGGI